MATFLISLQGSMKFHQTYVAFFWGEIEILYISQEQPKAATQEIIKPQNISFKTVNKIKIKTD